MCDTMCFEWRTPGLDTGYEGSEFTNSTCWGTTDWRAIVEDGLGR